MTYRNPIFEARKLRRNLSFEEQKLWECLRSRNFMGIKFRRKHPMKYTARGMYPAKVIIVDFYSAEQRLIVEIEKALPPAEANERRRALEKLSIRNRIVFIDADDIVDTEAVLRKITEQVLIREQMEPRYEEE